MDENTMILSKLSDLANKSYRQNIYTYSHFLSPADMSVFFSNQNDYSFAGFSYFGGREECDRLVIAFGNENFMGYEPEYPISTIMVKPLIDKFSDELNHRDFLGALMNLGVSRDMLGDIIVKESDKSGKKNTAFIFCLDQMADYIIDNLTKVKHTNVKCSLVNPTDLDDLKITKEEMQIICASPRIDAVIAAITKLSRSQVVELFREKKVYLNNRVFENNSYTLKEGDVLSARGYGKFEYVSRGGETRKGRVFLTLLKYT